MSLLAGLAASVAATTPALASSGTGPVPLPPPASPGAPPTAPAVNPVIEWNRTLLAIVRTKTPTPLQPPTIHATRAFAMLHLGIYDAVVAVERGDSGDSFVRERNFDQPASAPAAADQAAHDVLAALYPSQQAALDNELNADLAAIPAGPRLSRGIEAGQAAARAILANRAQDGSGVTPPPYTVPPGPGVFEPIAPATAVFTHWAAVKPFVLERANQFRPPAPASLNSTAYLQTIQQVQSLGRSTSTTRTPDQTTIATFWAGNIWDYWNEIAQSASLAHHDTLEQDALLFSQLNVAFADSVIAFYDAKYTYHLWRPITAIQSGFPGFSAEPGWTSLGKTPADPSYPGAHATISEAGATVLRTYFGRDAQPLTVTSEVMPGATRQFSSFSAAASEASLSRVFAGVHTQMDEEAGQRLGGQVARFILHSGPLASDRAVPTRHVHGTRHRQVTHRA
jgi:hypothetical protein